MKDYFQNDITLHLDLETHKEILSKSFGNDFSNGDYDARLIHNQRNPEYLQLTIYYKSSDFLFEKFKLLQKNGISILSTIKSKINSHEWEFPDKFEFSQSTLIDIQESHYWEHNKKPVILTIDNLNIIENYSYEGDGRFQLTKNIFQHLSEYIRYGGLGSIDYDDKFIEKDLNKETSFGPVRFILSFRHFYDPNYSIHNINILRDAYLTLTDDTKKLTDNQLINLGESLCLLMSFYWGKTIDYFIGNIRINDVKNYGTRKILKYSHHDLDYSNDFLLKTKFTTFYDFIDCVNYEKFNSNSRILHEITPRIIKTKNIDDISAFMILYNIIEKIRNHFLTYPLSEKKFEIKEEFDFTVSKTKTNEFIKNKIKEIKDIVEKSDLEEFEKKASDKVSFIRKTGLKDQFDSLLFYLELDSKSYKIDFTKLVNIRNNIYHGKLPKEDVKPYLEQMTTLIYDMILKMTIN